MSRMIVLVIEFISVLPVVCFAGNIGITGSRISGIFRIVAASRPITVASRPVTIGFTLIIVFFTARSTLFVSSGVVCQLIAENSTFSTRPVAQGDLH